MLDIDHHLRYAVRGCLNVNGNGEISHLPLQYTVRDGNHHRIAILG